MGLEDQLNAEQGVSRGVCAMPLMPADVHNVGFNKSTNRRESAT
jgi:hypothetical protein